MIMNAFVPMINIQSYMINNNANQENKATQNQPQFLTFSFSNLNDSSNKIKNPYFQNVQFYSMLGQKEHLNQASPTLKNNCYNPEQFNSMILSVNKHQAPKKTSKCNSVNLLIQMSKENEKINQANPRDKNQTSRRKFTENEDDLLKKVVKIFGKSNWRIISSLVPGRTPRQCRDRYTNYLAPGLVRLDWSDEEDKLLAEKFETYGPQWTLIRQFFPTRSPNDIKNRYNYTVCRKIHSYSKSDDIIEKENDSILDSIPQDDDIFALNLIDSGFIDQPDFYSGDNEFNY